MDGCPISSEAERQRLINCLEAAIKRRASEVQTWECLKHMSICCTNMGMFKKHVYLTYKRGN